MELFKDKTLVRILFLRCIHHEIVQYLVSLTLLRMWEREVKRLPTSFSPATCTKVGISSLNFLFLVLTLLPHWCGKISRSYLVSVPNY